MVEVLMISDNFEFITSVEIFVITAVYYYGGFTGLA